ncbi:hypothetical protein [Halopelagius longus]|uniref:Uncharacterized protein n=1 Tax=Halopelagius longus TaxID=1236180 RepID=A0A1H1FR68_9EURY|nr:hypothetical protein [Halopelagius longus]RDI70204.1 hypothetical protein DWB78_16455 [Halopelagius longus]SDR03380.1 hypothetical protein SAMN05216278_3363 [Halopelagius longus]
MTFVDWVDETREMFDRHPPLDAAKYATGELVTGAARRVGGRINYGTPHWERGDWDVLVVLDACRSDLFREVARETSWIDDGDVETHVSAASMSHEWLQRMTAEKYRDQMAETALVTGNPFTREDCVREDDWWHLDEVWRRSWSHEEGTVLPRPVTDGAIHAHRGGADRVIAWYMQPHEPFVPVDWSEGYDRRDGFGQAAQEEDDRSSWYQYRDGGLQYEELWTAYRKNLEFVLEEVELLLENVEGDVVISADHANALGEWGVFGHPRNSWVPAAKRVPWLELESTDQETYEPDPLPAPDDEADIDAQLEALGYK